MTLELNRIYCRDCLEGMREMSDKCVDLTVTSPPYNIGILYNGDNEYTLKKQKYVNTEDDVKIEQEYVKWLDAVLLECLRISRYVCWNVQFLRSTKTHIASIHENYRGNLKEIFIWKKQAVANINWKIGGLAKGWEYIFMLGADDKCTFPYNNFPSNGYVPNIQTWTLKDNANGEHHAMFPVVVPSYFISYFTKENDVVLDPFMGSGTTAVAAVRNGRQFIGFEKEQSYFDAAQARIKKAQAQGKISRWFE